MLLLLLLPLPLLLLLLLMLLSVFLTCLVWPPAIKVQKCQNWATHQTKSVKEQVEEPVAAASLLVERLRLGVAHGRWRSTLTKVLLGPGSSSGNGEGLVRPGKGLFAQALFGRLLFEPRWLRCLCCAVTC